MIDTDFKALVEGIEVHLGNGTPSDSLGNDLDMFIDRDGRKFWRKCNGKWTDNALYVLGPLFLTLMPPVGVSPDVAIVPVYKNGSIEWSGDIGSLDPNDFEPAGAVGTHNENPDAHSGTFDAAGAAAKAVGAHNTASAPHPGKFEAAGAVGAHNSSDTAHADIRELISELSPIGYPDYASGVDILAAYNVNDTYTATTEGWVVVITRVSQYFYVNGGIVSRSSSADFGGQIFPVKTGDVLTGDTDPYNLIFYPNR